MSKTITSSTGGTITFKYDKQGNQVGLVHAASSAYSGKLAAQEERQKPAKKKG